jgi:hypothetical protein
MSRLSGATWVSEARPDRLSQPCHGDQIKRERIDEAKESS